MQVGYHKSSSDQDRYRALLERLATLSPLPFMMGGFAEDALLYHRLTGRHSDLDVLVVRQQLNVPLQQLKALGFALSPDYLEATPGRPIVLKASVDDPQVEIWVSTPEPNGGYHFDVEGQPPHSHFRIFLPEDTFQYPATTIEGVVTQTVSPLALYQLRAISAMTRNKAKAEKQAQDWVMQELLRQAFLADQEERALAPRLIEL